MTKCAPIASMGAHFVIFVGLRTSPVGAGHAAVGAGADRGGLGEGNDRVDR
jgi:hypothetical protein